MELEVSGGRRGSDPRKSQVPSLVPIMMGRRLALMFSKSGSDLSAVSQIQRIWRGRTEPEPNFENIKNWP